MNIQSQIPPQSGKEERSAQQNKYRFRFQGTLLLLTPRSPAAGEGADEVRAEPDARQRVARLVRRPRETRRALTL
jgi:hypothetical protein